ncbi:CpaD family pilus assembly protein [Roseomonas sp. NAR14]|uniref:CpaD family pilus assembly protein n=1 Tax=Roseomonas acroporae TaxID=2937791 RepID=A0A9X1YB83_9PROT|nr:CpaD family pilus assembly protein [Roseomonas acroporae]MCK8785750.1 CpaD family pilus assembly protein [Roseomonas acroporae]
MMRSSRHAATRRLLPLLTPLSLALLVAACEGPADPFHAEGRWRPAGANEANLRAMVADPADLVRGRSDPRGDAQTATAAVSRLRRDQVRALPNTTASTIGIDGGGAGGR